MSGEFPHKAFDRWVTQTPEEYFGIEENICCICYKEFEGYGNNPYPIKESGSCCDKCNELVIVKRLELAMKLGNKEKK